MALPAIIGGGLGLAGIFAGGSKDKEIAAANRKFQKEMFWANERVQKDFAKHGIRWRVEDARKAGLSPLAALGGGTIGASPMQVGSTDMGSSHSNLPGVLEGMGQGIGRAISQTQSKEERAMSQLQMRNMKAQVRFNEARALDAEKNAQIGPGMPNMNNLIPGQGDSNVRFKPAEITRSETNRPHQEAGKITDVGFSRTRTGLAPIPSKDVKERIEEMIVPQTAWALRNMVLPNFGKGKPSKKHLKSFGKGYTHWRWNHLVQEWQPAKKPIQKPWQKKIQKKLRSLNKLKFRRKGGN